ERDLAEAARRNNVRVFGPNTNTNAFERMPEVPNLRGGKIGLLTQSGHNGRPVVQGSLFGVGFSRWVPTGNEADLEVADFEVGFVAGRYPAGEPDAEERALDHRPAVVAALGEQADLAATQVGYLRHALERVGIGVRAEHPHVVAAGRFGEVPL